MNAPELPDQLPTILSCLEDVCLIYLFGSQAEGCAGPMSDYDLGVLVEPAADGQQVKVQLARELAGALQTDRVDVVLLNRVPIELAYTVIAQGKLLYERDVATRVEYEADVMSRYGDYLPVLRAQRDDILRGEGYAHRIRRYRAALGRTERTLGQIAAVQGQGSD
jgi:predicted nucleotidyltransferase